MHIYLLTTSWLTPLLPPPPILSFFQCAVIKKEKGTVIWEPGSNHRVSVPLEHTPEEDGALGQPLYEGEEGPHAELVETSGGKTMVKLTTVYKADFGEYLKVVGGPAELGAWDAAAAPGLTWGEGDVWTATLELPAGEHELKVRGVGVGVEGALSIGYWACEEMVWDYGGLGWEVASGERGTRGLMIDVGALGVTG